MNVAVFASGGGSNFGAIAEHADRGDLPGLRLVLLVTNNSGCGAAEIARRRGMRVEHLSSVTHADAGAREERLLEVLEECSIDLIVLAGYMKLLPPRVVRRFPGAITNIHPALLPAFGGPGMYGIRVHEAVLRAGVRETGVTVHLVNERYDEGEVLARERVAVLPGDTAETLQRRVLEKEHDLYWRALRDLAAVRRARAGGAGGERANSGEEVHP